jgi:hypothetical protein
MTKDEALLVTGQNLKAEPMSDGRKPYYMDRHEVSIHMWALDALEPKSEMEEQEIRAERRRVKEYYEMRWP